MSDVYKRDVNFKEIDLKSRSEIASCLNKVLASSYILYLKTQNYHWNVVGHEFKQLHDSFEKQYLELAESIDTIAERIRALGFRAPGTFKSFQYHGFIKEDPLDTFLSSDQMLINLTNDHQTLAAALRSYLPVIHAANDAGTADLLSERLRKHEKVAWMLKSMLSDQHEFQSAELTWKTA